MQYLCKTVNSPIMDNLQISTSELQDTNWIPPGNTILRIKLTNPNCPGCWCQEKVLSPNSVSLGTQLNLHMHIPWLLLIFSTNCNTTIGKVVLENVVTKLVSHK